MKRYEAIGVVEAKYYTTALQVVDAMCKASEVEYLGSEKVLGGRLVTTIVGGSISSVKAAIEAARQVCEGREELLKNAVVITRPHEEIMRFIVKDEASEVKEAPKKKKGKKTEEINEEIKIQDEEK
jgi:microcompartment protein CcmL/EutN